MVIICQLIYNLFMDIKTQLKVILAIKRMTMQKLAENMTVVTGKKYTRAMLYGKINRDTISYTECQVIAKILGYRIEFVEE